MLARMVAFATGTPVHGRDVRWKRVETTSAAQAFVNGAEDRPMADSISRVLKSCFLFISVSICCVSRRFIDWTSHGSDFNGMSAASPEANTRYIFRHGRRKFQSVIDYRYL